MHIDLWTLALQTLNVLVLVWLLARFLFRPVAAIITARRDAANAMLAEAAATRQRASDDAAALAQQRAGLADDGQRILTEARAAAEAERATLLQHANEAAAKLQQDAQQAIARDRRSMQAALEREATDLALTIAQRLLQRVPPHALNHTFIDGVAEMLITHPFPATFTNTELELRSATPLDAAAQAEARDILTRALGAPPRLVFRTDPTLIAGVELAAPHALIRNCWRADLDRVAQALHAADSDVLRQPVA